MKITKEQLMKIIEEEVTVNLSEEMEDDTYYFVELDTGDTSMAFPKDGRSPEEFASVIIGDLDSKGRKRTFNVYEGDPMEAASSYAIWMVKEVPEGSTWPDGSPMENVEGYPGVSSFAPEADEADEEEEEAPLTDPEAYAAPGHPLQENTTKITSKQIKDIIQEVVTQAVDNLNEMGMGGIVQDQGMQCEVTAPGGEELPQDQPGMADRALALLVKLGELMTGTADMSEEERETYAAAQRAQEAGANIFNNNMTWEEGLQDASLDNASVTGSKVKTQTGRGAVAKLFTTVKDRFAANNAIKDAKLAMALLKKLGFEFDDKQSVSKLIQTLKQVTGSGDIGDSSEESPAGLSGGTGPTAIEEEEQLNEDKAVYAKWKRLL